MQDRFQKSFVGLDAATEQNITAIKDKAQELVQLIDNLGTSRQGAVAITSIETAVMWAEKAAKLHLYP